MYSNKIFELVMTILLTLKYLLLDWKIIFGYVSQVVQRNEIVDVLNQANRIEMQFERCAMNDRDGDDEYEFWCTAKQFANYFQVFCFVSSFVVGCLMYTNEVYCGDVLIFTVTVYCQLLPTILSNLYFFYLSMSFKFYRTLNRNIRSIRFDQPDCYHRIDEINCLYNEITKYTKRAVKVYTAQIAANLFYASLMILVEVRLFHFTVLLLYWSPGRQ